MIIEKEAKVANFNLVIGEEEEPMLNYFDTLVFPAFTSGIVKKEKDVAYTLNGVAIDKNVKSDYVLVGKIVKKTLLEIKSDLNEKGELVEKDEIYSAAPYSTFVIYLRNHRMVLIPNQKGSPTLAAFRSTTYYLLNEYRKKINKKLDKSNQISEIDLTVVGIPSASSIKDILHEVDRINELVLRFYPLNGDLNMDGLFGAITKELREAVGSKRGEIILRSPKKIGGIADVLEKSAGTVVPIITATTKEKTKLRVTETELSEKHILQLKETTDFDLENKEIINESSKIPSLQYTNSNHDSIYSTNQSKIIRFEQYKKGNNGGQGQIDR